MLISVCKLVHYGPTPQSRATEDSPPPASLHPARIARLLFCHACTAATGADRVFGLDNMNVQRSPPRVTGGSQPDLSKISNLSVDMNITQRTKRKWADDDQCSNDITGLRSEMSRISSLLEKYVSSNEQIVQNMKDSIADLKTQIIDMKSSNEQSAKAIRDKVDGVQTQINEIKISTTNVLTEQKEMKNNIAKLDESVAIGQNKIKYLESDLCNLKQKSQTTSEESHDVLSTNEQIIKEMKNRNNREKNIILVGLQEQTSSKAEERMSQDEFDVLNVIASLSTDIPKPIKVVRLGKYNSGKSRNIKVYFDTNGPTKTLLRNKDKLPKNIKIYSDQTPAQQNYLKKLKEELKCREDKGETDLTIKYISGTPTIIKVPSKNLKQ